MQLLDLFKNYLTTKSGSNSANTIKNYLSDVRHFIGWFEATTNGSFSSDKVTPESLTLYEKSMGGVIRNGSMIMGTQLSAASMKRHLSSLRLFFTFMQTQGLSPSNPFTQIPPKVTEIPTDYWHLKSFKDYLLLSNASKITIKNYLSDIQSFAKWYEEAILPSLEHPLTSTGGFYLITQNILEEYRQRLIEIQNAAPRTINRKLSSLRRYLDFAAKKGFIKASELTLDAISLKEGVSPKKDERKLTLTELSLPLEEQRSYSRIPPFRLAQKLIIFPYLLLEEKSANIIAGIITGKPVSGAYSLPKKLAEQLKEKNLLRSQTGAISALLGVKNVGKEFYAPDKVSLLGAPLHARALFHLRHTRPKWYKKYHNYAFVHYTHFALLVIFAAGVGVALYSNLVTNTRESTYAAPTSPPRILSFQGRLTDSFDNPITSTTNLRFAIYNDSVASGGALLWQEVNGVSPDQDGIFSIYLGGGTSIPSTVFTDNSSIYLGVTVGETPELTPRQRIATVGYATNAEFLQGLPPTTQSGITSFSNVILALDSSGNLTLSDSSPTDHTFQVTNGAFRLTGQTLNLTTNTGSGGNVILAPDGFGYIDAQKGIINNTLNGSILPGGVEVRDRFGVLATESAVAAFIVNNNTTGGDIFAASSSGTTRFVIQNDGTLVTSAYNGQNGIIYGEQSTGILAQATTGSSGLCLLSGISNPAWGDCTTGLTDSPFEISGGSIVARNATYDLLVGGASTTAAKFAILNSSGARGTQTATLSGNIVLDSTGSLQTTNGQTLSIGNGTSGNLILGQSGKNISFAGLSTCTALETVNGLLTCGTDDTGISGYDNFWQYNMSTGIVANGNLTTDLLLGGVSTDSAKFAFTNVASSLSPIASISATTSSGGSGSGLVLGGDGTIQSLRNNTLTIGGNTTGDIQFKPGNSSTSLYLASSGNVGIGTTAPTEKFAMAGGNFVHTALGNPTLEGTYNTPDLAEDVYVSGKYAYVADGNGLEIIDISNTSSPQSMGSYTTTGYAQNIYVAGKYAYIAAQSDGLEIIDISNPLAPREIGSYNTPGFSLGVYVSGKYAYLADSGSGLHILDVSNPASPQLIGTYDTTGNVEDVYIVGKYAYLADFNGGLQIIDVSNPASPQLIGTYDTTGSAEDVYVSGKYAYVADSSDGLQIIDVSNPASPQLIGTYDTTGSAVGIYVVGKYAYLADSDSGLHVVEVSNPASPQLIGTYDTSGSAVGIYVSGKHAYVTDFGAGLQIIDINGIDTPAANIGALSTNTLTVTENANIANNLIIGNGLNIGFGGLYSNGAFSFSTASGAGNLIQGAPTGKALLTLNQTGTMDILAASASGITKFTIKNDGTASSSAGFTIDGLGALQSTNNQTLTIGGNMTGDIQFKPGNSSTSLYLASSGNVGIGTTAPTEKFAMAGGNFTHTASGNPTLEGSIVLGNANDVYVSGKFAYVTDNDLGLQIYDVSNPSSPELIGSRDTPSAGNVFGIAVAGRYAYLAAQAGGLVVMDITNPLAPSTSAVETTHSITEVTVSGNYLYATAGTNGLIIYDITDPNDPFVIGSYDTAGSVIGLTVVGKYAYLSGTSGLMIVDISSPTSPQLIGTMDPGSPEEAYVAGRYAYVAGGSAGLYIFDVIDPASPQLISTLDTTDASDVFVAGKYAYVADGSAGLRVIDVSNPSSPQLVGTLDTTSAYELFVTGKYAYIADRTGGLVIADINGIETPALEAGAIQTNALTVTENADFGNNVYIKNGLNVGFGGIFSNGPVTINPTASSAAEGNALNVSGGGIKIHEQTDAITALSKVSQSQAGQIESGGTTLIASISASAVFNGSLYVGTAGGSGTPAGGAEVYRYNGTSGNWSKVSQSTAGTIAASGTSAIASVSAMTVFNGDLYVGTYKTGGAEVYRYNGSTSWTKVSAVTAGTIGGGGETSVDGVTAMAVWGGKLYIGTTKGDATGIGRAELYRYEGAGIWTKISGGATGTIGLAGTVGISSMTVFNNALVVGTKRAASASVNILLNGTSTFLAISPTNGTFCTGATTTFEIPSLAVYNGSLYAGTRSNGGTASVCRYDGRGGIDTAGATVATWSQSIQTAGTIRNGGTSAITAIKSMLVYNGRFYIGTEKANAAEIYQNIDGPNWMVLNSTPGTLASGGTSNIDKVNTLIQYNSQLFAGTGENVPTAASGAEVYVYSNITDQSYALKFHAASGSVAETNNLQNEGSMWFMASSSAQLSTGAGANTGSFMFSHGIITGAGAYDVAEDYPTRDGTLKPGDLVEIEPNEKGFVRRTTGADSKRIIGVYSENPGFRLSQKDPLIDGAQVIPVALVGRVPLKVSSENGPIKIGDPITASSLPGVGAKATKEGQIVGKALESLDCPEHTSPAASSSATTTPSCEGKIMVFVNVSWFNLEAYIGDQVSYAIGTTGPDGDPVFSVLRTEEYGGPSVVERIGAFSKAVIATIEAGFINTQKLATNALAITSDNITIGGQNIREFILETVRNAGLMPAPVSPLASINEVKANILSPLVDDPQLQVKLNKDNLEIKNSTTGATAAWFDNNGNATFSGELEAQKINADTLLINTDATVSGNLAANSSTFQNSEIGNLRSENVTISGTLHADTIVANNIEGLDNKISSIAGSLIASNFTGVVNAGMLTADFGIFEQGITSMGPITSTILTATDQLGVGANFTIANNAINTIGTDLEIQSFRQGNIAFQGGLIKMDTDGNMQIAGNLNVLGEIDAVFGVFSGTLTTKALATSIISPLPGGDLTIKLTDDAASRSSKLRIASSQNQEVLSINNKGDLISSGSGTFAKLNFSLVGQAIATSLTEAVATGSAGFATLRAGQPELTIKNPNITSKSLIYITPFGDTGNKVLYLLRQVPAIDEDGLASPTGGSFTVGISGPTSPQNIQFNWLIVN